MQTITSPGAWRARLPYLLTLAVLIVNAICLFPELEVSRLDLNDNLSHFNFTQHMVQSIEHGQDPLDFWDPDVSFGYPVLRTYQPLAYAIVAFFYFLFGKAVSLMTIFVWVRYLALILLPLTFFVMARLLGLSAWTAAATALLSPLVSTNGLFGIEYGSNLWAGNGLYPQLIATHLLLLSVGLSFYSIRRGRRVALAGFVLGLTFLAHFIFGYMGALTAVLLIFLPAAGSTRMQRLRRVFVIGALALIVSAFQLSSLWIDGPLISRSRWVPAWKYDSVGVGSVAEWLFTGEILDHGRFPVLSLLALLGVVTLVWQRRKKTLRLPEWASLPAHETHIFIAAGALLWLALFCGRPTWGPLLIFLGLGDDVQLHRFLAGAHLFLLPLSAIGLTLLWQWAYRYWLSVGAVLATVVLLVAPVRERAQLLSNNNLWGHQNLQAYEAEKANLEPVLTRVKDRGGRVYPGLAGGWGSNLKVGFVPIYGFLFAREIPAVAFLYHAMALTGDSMVRFNEWNDAHYRLFNIKSVIAGQTPVAPFLALLEQRGPFRVLEAPGSGYFDLIDVPFAVHVDRYQVYDIDDKWMQSDWVQKRQHIGLELKGSSVGASLSGLPQLMLKGPLPKTDWLLSPGNVLSETDRDGVFQATIQAARQSYGLFRMTYHPNWTATIDGQRVPTIMVSPGFTAFPVPSGKHNVKLEYQPPQWRLMLACAGLLFAALAAAGETRFKLS